MSTTNSYNKPLSIFFACVIASIAVLAISPGQAEACGDYGSFLSEDDRIERAVKNHIFQLGLEDQNRKLVNASSSAEGMPQFINDFAIEIVRRKGQRAVVKLRRLSDGQIQKLVLRNTKGYWDIVRVRTQRKRSRRAIRA